MRTLFALALAAALSLPSARAQISFAPMVGYDIDAEALSLGIAFELATPIAALPLQPSIRPSAEYIFADGDITYVRVDGDLIGRLNATPTLQPYVKAGPTIEFVSIDGIDDSNTEVGINLGGGAEFNRIFVEGALGLGDISDFRIRAGYRF